MPRKEILREKDVRCFIRDLSDEVAEEMEANGNEGFYLDLSDNNEYCGLGRGFKIEAKASREADVYLCSVIKNSKDIGENRQFSFFIGSSDLR